MLGFLALFLKMRPSAQSVRVHCMCTQLGRCKVADRGNQRVQVIDKHGNFVTRWTQFGMPSAIAIDTKGHIYVADACRMTIGTPAGSAAFTSVI
jgi:hypothetical protein